MLRDEVKRKYAVKVRRYESPSLMLKHSPLIAPHKAVLLLAVMAMSACANVPDLRKLPDGSYKHAWRNVPYAATAPIRDFNIGKRDVPEQLATLQNPYGTDTQVSCRAVYSEMRALEQALGRNSPTAIGTLHRTDTRAGNLGNAADATTKAISTSLVPFRGLVRFATGATYKDKAVLEADRRGRERIGFLIGVGSANRCPGFNLHTPKLR